MCFYNKEKTIEDDEIRGPMRSIITECKAWAMRDCVVIFKHLFCEQNEVADILAYLAEKIIANGQN